jgi:hypothetical protein
LEKARYEVTGEPKADSNRNSLLAVLTLTSLTQGDTKRLQRRPGNHEESSKSENPAASPDLEIDVERSLRVSEPNACKWVPLDRSDCVMHRHGAAHVALDDRRRLRVDQPVNRVEGGKLWMKTRKEQRNDQASNDCCTRERFDGI